jgi:hypothetical protein
MVRTDHGYLYHHSRIVYQIETYKILRHFDEGEISLH